MSEVVNIPQLRFPEFSGDWDERRLGDVFDVFNGYSFSSNDAKSEGTRWVKIADVGIQRMKSENISYLPDYFQQQYERFLLRQGDYVIALTRPILNKKLKIAKIDKDFDGSLLNQRVGKLLTKNVYSFVYTLLQRSKLIDLINKNILGTEPPNLSMSQISTLKAFIPVEPEQQKIATFLIAVDTKIEQLSKKQELLGEYKKGAMQQIFSQVIRFKADDGSTFPDWEEKKLGDIGQTFNGLIGKTKDDFGKGKPYIQYMQIFESSKINIDNFGLVDVRDDENQKAAQYGDVFFTTSSETPNAVGYSSVLLNDIDELYLNSFCFGFRPNSLDELSPNFAQFLLRSANFRKRVVRLAQGSTRYNMSKVQLMKEVIGIPSLEEQTKIANFLSSIDNKIEQVGKQLDESKQFKKALLQQMFV